MKKVMILTLLLWVLSGNAAFSGDLGNPALLIDQGQFDVGFQWTSRFKQSFEDYDLSRTYSDGYRDSGKKGADFENGSVLHGHPYLWRDGSTQRLC